MSKNNVVSFDVSFNDKPILVEYKYTEGSAGSFYARNGDPGDPPEPPEVEILKATCEGVEQTLTEEDMTELMDLIMDFEEADEDDDYDDEDDDYDDEDIDDSD